ncbi:hypothetical protein, partial [Streptomyces sp. H39-C1]|uniref:hypothetical protein n=1 Tax=Streptomyces sp. H39-C1 TaxID=3004355 RepID=UPI0022AEE817
AVITADDEELYALVPDSSSIHAVNAKFDGKRMIVTCSREHLAQLVEQYEQRPFVPEELWTGKIGRALVTHPDGIRAQELAEETGLDLNQIERAVKWNNRRVRRRWAGLGRWRRGR